MTIEELKTVCEERIHDQGRDEAHITICNCGKSSLNVGAWRQAWLPKGPSGRIVHKHPDGRVIVDVSCADALYCINKLLQKIERITRLEVF